MTNSIPRIPVSVGYNQLKNEAMKDLMDILKGTQNMPLKNTVQIKSNETRNNALESNYGKDGTQAPVKHQQAPNKDVLIQTLKQIVEGYQINDQGNLFLKTNNIPKELLNQHDKTIEFKGEFFNFLRNITQQHSGSKTIENAVADVLRAYVALTSKTKHENKIAENIDQLIQLLSSKKSDSPNSQINELKQLLQENQSGNELKNLLPLLKEMAGQYSKEPKIMAVMNKIAESYGKIQALEDQGFSLHKSLKHLLEQLPDSKFAAHFKEWDHKFEQLFSLQENQGQNDLFQQPKTVMDKIIAMFIKTGTIEDGADNEKIMEWLTSQFDKDTMIESSESKNTLEKILSKLMDKSQQLSDKEGLNTLTETFLKGMTASQAGKHPLLHFLLPIKFEDVQAMGEIWIDPNDQKDGEDDNHDKSSTHMFLTLNVEQVGSFELDILLSGKSIDIQLYCPPSMIHQFSDSGHQISQIIQRSGLHLNTFDMTLAKKNRRLNEIFPDSFEKRMGVNVKA